ncbi:MAG: hypothetical protein ACTHU0_30335 [Kofleriaceae bacterium]
MIVTSADGQWVAIRRGREIALLARGEGAPVARIQLESDDADLTFAGPPHALAVVARDRATRVVLYPPPTFEAAAGIELDARLHLATTTGPRLALLSRDGKLLRVIRTAGRALGVQPIEVDSAVELAVGLGRNQLLLGLYKRLEMWDAVSGRSLQRSSLPLPPPPRTVGFAKGHLWATRSGTDEVLVYRLSDGRPFVHQAGSPVERVISHPASPSIVLVTRTGLVRLNCFAHGLSPIATAGLAWTLATPLALLPAGDEIYLIGIGFGAETPWRVSITRPA